MRDKETIRQDARIWKHADGEVDFYRNTIKNQVLILETLLDKRDLIKKKPERK